MSSGYPEIAFYKCYLYMNIATPLFLLGEGRVDSLSVTLGNELYHALRPMFLFLKTRNNRIHKFCQFFIIFTAENRPQNTI